MKGSADRRDDGAGRLAFYAQCAAGRSPGPTPDRETRSRSRRTWVEDDRFDQSISDFSERYADQNEQDYQAFIDAIRSGRLEAVEGV